MIAEHGCVAGSLSAAQPYHVKTTSGAMWWYKAEAVKLAGDSIAVDVVARLGQVSEAKGGGRRRGR